MKLEPYSSSLKTTQTKISINAKKLKNDAADKAYASLKEVEKKWSTKKFWDAIDCKRIWKAFEESAYSLKRLLRLKHIKFPDSSQTLKSIANQLSQGIHALFK
jgi:hypothetical protein